MSNTRILIVAPAWVGDLVISLALLNALKEINNDSLHKIRIANNLFILIQ